MTNLSPVRSRWGVLAAVWWLSYGVLAVFWAAGGHGWPFAVERPAAQAGALMVGLDPALWAPVVAVVSFAVCGITVVLALGSDSRARRAAPVAWGLVACIALVVPDARLLLTFFQMITGDTQGLVWPVVNQAACVFGLLLTGLAAHARRIPVERRGRPAWSAAAFACALVAPLVYAGIRAAWAMGLAIGASEEFLAPYTQPGARVTEALIAALTTTGALLTWGLRRPWGERLPRWTLGLAGRRIPPMTAVIPGLTAAVLLLSAGVALSRGLLAMAWGLTPATESAAPENWGAWLAAPLWGLWGAGLGLTTLAYYRRRKNQESK